MVLTDSQKWLVLAGVLITGGLLWALAPILAPFLFAFILAYLGDPLVDALERRRVSRTGAATIVVLLLGIVVVVVPLLLLPVLGPQVRALIGAVPKVLDWVTGNAIPWLNATLTLQLTLPDAVQLKAAFVENLEPIGSASVDVVRYVSRSGLALTGWLATAVLVPVVTFYMLRDWDHFIAAIHDLLPRAIEPDLSALTREVDEVLGAFLRGQLTVMACLAVVYTAGLALLGVEAALAIGLMSGVVSFVPYLGILVGLVTAALSVLTTSPDLLLLAGVGAVFAVGQMLEGMVLTPMLVGDRIGLHPVTVIFAVLAGAQLFGFMGVLLALPVASGQGRRRQSPGPSWERRRRTVLSIEFWNVKTGEVSERVMVHSVQVTYDLVRNPVNDDELAHYDGDAWIHNGSRYTDFMVGPWTGEDS